MKKEELSQANKVYSRIEILERVLEENRGRNPINITIGMGSPLTLECDTELYNFFITGLYEELDRLHEVFRQL